MLKSNSKQARENIRAYILDHYDPAGYDLAPAEGASFEPVALFLWDTFQAEKFYSYPQQARRCMTDEMVFAEWAAGLPSVLDTCYYYNRPAVPDVQKIMDQTSAEAARYDEPTAEAFLSHLIFREIHKVVEKYHQETSLYNRLIMQGYTPENIHHHETDLYIYDSKLTRKIIKEWCQDNGYNPELFVEPFTDNTTGLPMFDIAFQYTPAWDRKRSVNNERN